ncbi:MAG: helix-turn-helix domain-containing protein [Pseudomonadota bacterium]
MQDKSHKIGNLGISPAQCRAARALLSLSQEELAKAAGIATRTLVSFESGARPAFKRTQNELRTALEAAGAEFIPSNGGGPGVRLRTPM